MSMLGRCSANGLRALVQGLVRTKALSQAVPVLGAVQGEKLNIPTMTQPRIPSIFMQVRNNSCGQKKSKDPDDQPCSKKCPKIKRKLPGCVFGTQRRRKCKKVKLRTFEPESFPEKSVWETKPPYEKHWDEFPIHPNKECLPPCCRDWPRHDKLYYRPSDKTRKFQQTWIECPKLVMANKCICTFDKIELDYVKRKPKKCKMKKKCPDWTSKCPILGAPCCREGRRPPKCKPDRGPANCTKICCPFPAYSECCQKPPARIPGRPPECFCLPPPPMCIAYRELRKAEKRKKKK